MFFPQGHFSILSLDLEVDIYIYSNTKIFIRYNIIPLKILSKKYCSFRKADILLTPDNLNIQIIFCPFDFRYHIEVCHVLMFTKTTLMDLILKALSSPCDNLPLKAFVSLIPVHIEVYSIQIGMILFVSSVVSLKTPRFHHALKKLAAMI